MSPYCVTYSIDGEKGKPDGRLRCRVRLGNERAAFLVGFRVERGKWNKEAGRCKSNTLHGKKQVHASVINSELQRIEDAVRRVYEHGGTLQDVLDSVRGGKDLSGSAGMYADYEQFLAIGKERWADGTLKSARIVCNRLRAFAPKAGYKDVNNNFLDRFVRHLALQNLGNDYIETLIKRLKWFFKWAAGQGYTECDISSYKASLKKVVNPVIFLTWEELMSIYNLQFPRNKRYLERTRDAFCFQCFTSLRHSDLCQLRKSDIYGGCIHLTSIKTLDNMVIELNKYSKAILSKYEKEEYPVPQISDQKMNEYLKEVGRLAGLDCLIRKTHMSGNRREERTYHKWELLTTHVGRRTFISNAIMMGIPPEIVMKWTGHSDYKAMKPYIAIADKAKRDAMKLFDDK